MGIIERETGTLVWVVAYGLEEDHCARTDPGATLPLPR